MTDERLKTPPTEYKPSELAKKIARAIVNDQWGYMREWKRPYAREFLDQRFMSIAYTIDIETGNA